MIKLPIDRAIWQNLSVDEQIDLICDAFEVAWQEGKSPNVTDYAALLDSSVRARLLRELMMVSKEFRETEKRIVRSKPPRQHATLSLQGDQIDTDLTFLPPHDVDSPESFERELPTDFGDYILLEVLGRGSFGIVYRAESTRTGGIFAVKIPHPVLIADPDNYKVFVRESRNVAMLRHRGVVKVHDVEYENRIPFLVSEYVSGKNLKDFLAATGKLPPRFAARFVLELAETIQHSHQEGVIHRDIKPSNILVENSEGITSLDDCLLDNGSFDAGSCQDGLISLMPRLLDFGIAKIRGSNTLVTQAGVVLGTPSYMSPEQARGDSSLVTPQSDIYSLGTVLYELLCGSPPFQGEPSKVIQQVQSEEVPLLLNREPSIPKDLAVICQQTLRLEPEARYDSAASFAEDLRRFLNDEPILGKPISLRERLTKKIRKHSAVWAVATVASLVVIACVALAWRSYAMHRSLIANLLVSDPKGLDGAAVASRLEDWLESAPQSFADTSPLLDGIIHAGPDRLLRIGSALLPHRLNALTMLKVALDANEDIPDVHHRIACLIGVVDQEAFERLGVSAQLTDWLVDSACFGDTGGWGQLTMTVRKSIIPELMRRYRLSRSGEQHTVAYKLLRIFLEKDSLEQVVDAIMVSPAQELLRWKLLLEGDPKKALGVLAARRQSLGLNFGVDAEGESNSAAFANLLLVEFGLGNQNVIWPYLAIADDPRIRSYFVHQFSYTGFDVRPLVDRVSDESDASIQYAILLAISQCSRKQLGEDSVAKIQAWLPNAYRTHPDCGVHSMCRWLMQQWGLEESLQAIDQQLREEGIVTGRNWYVNRLGMQMLIVNGPVDLVTHDLVLKGRTSTANAIQSRPYRIPRSFAIGTDAVTVGQYLQFQEDIQHDHDHPALLDPTTMASSPVDRVSWINAMDYCQWLSIQTGISESQAGNCVKIDLETVEVDYEKSGYRLPTKAEWEYSCRAGTITDCSYGTIDTPGRELYVAQSSEPSAITRAYLPNAYGMFACLGNASNMVSTSFSEASRNATSDPEKEIVSMRLGTYLFGGASMNRMSTSWNFFFNMPKVARANVGFRIAHTVTLTRNLP